MTDIQMELDFVVLLNVVGDWTSKWTCGHREVSFFRTLVSSWSLLQSIRHHIVVLDSRIICLLFSFCRLQTV